MLAQNAHPCLICRCSLFTYFSHLPTYNFQIIVLSVVSIRLRVHYKVTFEQCSHLVSTEIKYEHAHNEFKVRDTCNCKGMKENRAQLERTHLRRPGEGVWSVLTRGAQFCRVDICQNNTNRLHSGCEFLSV